MWRSPLLLLASVLALVAGRCVQFDDTSGFGWGREIGPLILLALVLGVAAVVMALRGPKSCRLTGGLLLTLFAGLIVTTSIDGGFRFIWLQSEDLPLLEFVLLLIGLGMVLLPAARADGRPGVGLRRGVLTRLYLYLLAAIVALIVAFVVGTSIAEQQQPAACDDCDLAPLGGLVFAIVTLPVLLCLYVLNEARIGLGWRRRPRGSRPGPARPPPRM